MIDPKVLDLRPVDAKHAVEIITDPKGYQYETLFYALCGLMSDITTMEHANYKGKDEKNEPKEL